LSRAIEDTDAGIGFVARRVSKVEELQEQNKDLEIAELRRQITVKDKNLESLRETMLSNKQTQESRTRRLQEKLNGLEEEVSL